MLGVGPEVRVVDVQVQLVPRRLDPLGHLQVRGQVAVARRRVHPQAQADVVEPVVVEDRQGAAGDAAVGEVRACGLLLGLEGQVGAPERHDAGGHRRERPELTDARRRAVVVGHVDLDVARPQRAVAAASRPAYPRAASAAGGLGTGCERVRIGAGADVDQRCRGRIVQGQPEAVERADAAQVDGHAARPLGRAPLRRGVAVDRLRRRRRRRRRRPGGPGGGADNRHVQRGRVWLRRVAVVRRRSGGPGRGRPCVWSCVPPRASRPPPPRASAHRQRTTQHQRHHQAPNAVQT